MNEQFKYETIKKLIESDGNKNTAAMKLGLTRRQVDRLIIAYKERGKAAFAHGNRGRKPVTTIPDKIKKDVVDLYKTKYYEANLVHYTELLKRLEGIRLSVSCVTSILEAANIYSPRITKAKKRRIKEQLNAARDAAKTKKEAEIIDANLVAVEHAHSRRPRCAYFDDQETLNGYYNIYSQILHKYGIPYKFFTDRRTVFTYKKKNVPDIGEDTCTQFAYACKQLGTQIEYSSVPQAKGRVERMFETLQSRLPVELRLANVTNLTGANEFLDSYIDEFNAKFSLPVNDSKSVFEKQPSNERINLILAVLTQRTVDSGHCVQFDKKYYRMLDTNGLQVHYAKGTKVLVIQSFDKKLFCSVNDKDVYVLEEIPKQSTKSKDFDIECTQEKPRKQYIPPMNHPWRSGYFWKFVKSQKHHLTDDVSA